MSKGSNVPGLLLNHIVALAESWRVHLHQDWTSAVEQFLPYSSGPKFYEQLVVIMKENS